MIDLGTRGKSTGTFACAMASEKAYISRIQLADGKEQEGEDGGEMMKKTW